MICDLYDGCAWNKKEALTYIAGWQDYLDPKLVADMYFALDRDDYKTFKQTCMDYMRAYGYEGSIAWKKFKAMPIKGIKAMLNA